MTLAPFADARLLCEPEHQKNIDVNEETEETDEERDILGELAITAKLMITGGELREIERLNRADESTIRACILEAAQKCTTENRPVLTEDVIAAFERRADAEEGDFAYPIQRHGLCNATFHEVCMATFNRAGSSWPEADVTIVDPATFARGEDEAQW